MCYLLTECFQYPFEVALSSYPLWVNALQASRAEGKCRAPLGSDQHADLQAPPLPFGFCTQALLLCTGEGQLLGFLQSLVTHSREFPHASLQPSQAIHWNHLIPLQRSQGAGLGAGRVHWYLRVPEAQLVLGEEKRGLETQGQINMSKRQEESPRSWAGQSKGVQDHCYNRAGQLQPILINLWLIGF